MNNSSQEPIEYTTMYLAFWYIGVKIGLKLI